MGVLDDVELASAHCAGCYWPSSWAAPSRVLWPAKERNTANSISC